MTKSTIIELKAAETDTDYSIAKGLFLEYASQLGVDLSFQDFNKEIETIQSGYAPPFGAIFIAYNENQSAVGCFAIRKFEDSVAELKRMYLRQQMQGYGFGKAMLLKSIEIARIMGYKKMRLDTLPTMHAAIKLYTTTGFYEIPPYRFNPIEGTKYFEIQFID